jgi:hypothetical protein
MPHRYAGHSIEGLFMVGVMLAAMAGAFEKLAAITVESGVRARRETSAEIPSAETMRASPSS